MWTGSQYGVAWSDHRHGDSEIYFARIDADGNKIGTGVRVTNAADDSRSSSLVWTGREFGVSFADHRDGAWEIYFARLDASGDKLDEDVRLTHVQSNSDGPGLTWTGSEYGVFWQDSRNAGGAEIYFVRLDA